MPEKADTQRQVLLGTVCIDTTQMAALLRSPKSSPDARVGGLAINACLMLHAGLAPGLCLQ